MQVDAAKLKGRLAERGLTQWRFAKRLGYKPSTFSDYVRGAREAPPDFAARVESGLKLDPGALASSAARLKKSA